MKKAIPDLPEEIVLLGLQMARQGFEADEIPVGAVIFNSDTFDVIATAHNQTIAQNDPLAHAEVVAIREACQKLNVKQLVGYSIFSTLETCVMCAGAISWARLDHLYFGASDPKSGAVLHGAHVFSHPQTHHKPLIQEGLLADQCGLLMSEFFKAKRKK